MHYARKSGASPAHIRPLLRRNAGVVAAAPCGVARRAALLGERFSHGSRQAQAGKCNNPSGDAMLPYPGSTSKLKPGQSTWFEVPRHCAPSACSASVPRVRCPERAPKLSRVRAQSVRPDCMTHAGLSSRRASFLTVGHSHITRMRATFWAPPPALGSTPLQPPWCRNAEMTGGWLFIRAPGGSLEEESGDDAEHGERHLGNDLGVALRC